MEVLAQQIGFIGSGNMAEAIIRGLIAADDIAFGDIARAGDRIARAGGGDGGDHHLVQGQRPGLIGADYRHRAQGLDRWQPPDNGVAPGHGLHADGQRVVLFGVRDLVVVSIDGLTLVTTVDASSDLKRLVDSLPSDLREPT
mgnify:CR=1 FL=1